MTDLVEFLEARLDDDEATAKAMPFEGEWSVRLEGAWQKVMAGSLPVASGADVVLPHIARHDPARVLRKVEAKRRIIARHALRHVTGFDPDGMEHDSQECTECVEDWPCPTLRLLALPYADHTDYGEKWKP
jgi:hypothetical protein